MFRLVGFPEKKKEDQKYLEKVVGETISAGLRYAYGENGKLTADLFLIMLTFEQLEFFDGLSQYIHEENDMEAGFRLVRKKAEKMIEKMDDPEESYTFDVFEELLFFLAITRCNIFFESGREPCEFYDAEKEKEVKEELKRRFKYNERRAGKIAGKVTRFHEMALKEDEEENMFFWDSDFQVVFNENFVEGIKFLKGFGGERLGYGYDYAREIFTDIGLKPPLKLLGTKEANRIVNQEAEKRYIEMMEKMMDDLKN